MSESKHTFKNNFLLLGLLTYAVIPSCLSQNEHRAEFAIAQLLGAQECKVYHGIETGSINGVSQPSKWTVTLKIKGVDDFDKLKHKEMLTSIAALRYCQWEDMDPTRNYDQVNVEIRSGKNIFSKVYPKQVLDQASILEPVVDSLFRALWEKRMDDLRDLVDAGISDSALARAGSVIMKTDSTKRTMKGMSVLGFTYNIEDGHTATGILFYIGMEYGDHTTACFDVGVNSKNRQIIQIDSFDPNDSAATN
jgi:hypothetical protein